jgi:hypothetical protein
MDLLPQDVNAGGHMCLHAMLAQLEMLAQIEMLARINGGVLLQ